MTAESTNFPTVGSLSDPDALIEIILAASEGIVVVDAEGRVRFCNPAAARLFGRPIEDLVGSDLGLPVGSEVAEIELRGATGEIKTGEVRVGQTSWADEEVSVLTLHDVTFRKTTERELSLKATHDELTGLPNRGLLDDRLEQAIARLKRDSAGLALMFVDLDGFKAINDTWGRPGRASASMWPLCAT